MNCHREDELLDALGAGFVGPELTAHLDSCTSCSELRLVAGAVLDDRAHAMTEAALPSSGSMWWRMQMRHRQEAQATARRSLLIGQAATLSIAIALMWTFFGGEVATGVKTAIEAIRLNTPLVLAVATTALLAPLASYIAIRK